MNTLVGISVAKVQSTKKVSKIRQIMDIWTKDEKNLPAKPTTKAVKFRGHVICISLGLVITIGTTYIAGGILAHIAPIGVALPSMLQEAYDRIFGL